jgi:2-(1,2-epoxy-1,2-dihydrophenyl)acetyl-CoA isomerase
MSVPELRQHKAGPVHVVTLDRPAVRNALTVGMRMALRDALVEADADPDVRVVVVTGAGGHFCAGGDVNEFDVERTEAAAHEYATTVAQAVFRALRHMRTPTVARVEGVAAGAGMFLALGCDVVVASEDARFVASHLDLAVPPDWGAMWLLPRLVGLARAKALLLSRRPLPAATAAEWGLIAECAPAGRLDEVVEGWCADLASVPPMPLALTRAGLDRSLDTPLDGFLDWEAGAIALAIAAPEHRERVRQFIDRRRERTMT